MRKTTDTVSRVQIVETLALFALVTLLADKLLIKRDLVWLAVVFLAVALFVRPLASFIVRRWLKFSDVVANFNNKVILLLIFYFVLTPVALLYRLFHKDPLNLRRQQAGSYYSERNHTYDASDLEKMW